MWFPVVTSIIHSASGVVICELYCRELGKLLLYKTQTNMRHLGNFLNYLWPHKLLKISSWYVADTTVLKGLNHHAFGRLLLLSMSAHLKSSMVLVATRWLWLLLLQLAVLLNHLFVILHSSSSWSCQSLSMSKSQSLKMLLKMLEPGEPKPPKPTH